MKKTSPRPRTQPIVLARVLRWVVTAVAVCVPLAASSTFYNSYAAPKIALLTVGAATLLGFMGYATLVNRRCPVPRSPTTIALFLYCIGLVVSTIASIDPVISLQGSFASDMGLLAWLSFIVCAFGVIAATNGDRGALVRLLVWMVATGGVVALVGLGQLAANAAGNWSAVVAGDESIRIYSTLGHPDYAGNFLLFPLFVAVGLRSAVDTRIKRTVCDATAVLATIAIVFTGTRGAWVGAAVGLLLGFILLARRMPTRLAIPSRRGVALAAIIAASLACVVLFTGLGATVRNRAAKFAAEGYSGAGRTTLWTFSAGMVPAYWLTGCGLETFRIAQLPFKTAEFERAMNGTAAEDPHSAYLSHLIATGVAVTVLYLVVILTALLALLAGVRNSRNSADRTIGLGLLCALSATLVHDLFLHHMLADGLYLFLFVGVAASWRRAVAEDGNEPATARCDRPVPPARILKMLVASICVMPALAASAYAFRLLAADRNIRLCQAAAEAGNDDLTRLYGTRAAAARLYQTDYDFLYAAALERLVERNPQIDSTQRLEYAHAEAVLARDRTLTPVNSLVSSALLAIRLGLFDEAADDLKHAETLDPVSGLPQLGWSSYYFNRGMLDEAVERYAEACRRGIRFTQAEALHAKLREAVRSSPNKRRLKRLLRGVEYGTSIG